MSLYSKSDYDALYTKPCECVRCDQCHGGITEVCERCQTIEEMEADEEEHREREVRAKGDGAMR